MSSLVWYCMHCTILPVTVTHAQIARTDLLRQFFDIWGRAFAAFWSEEIKYNFDWDYLVLKVNYIRSKYVRDTAD